MITLFLIALGATVVVISNVCATFFTVFTENPFVMTTETWTNTENLNVVGRLICASFVTIFFLPASILAIVILAGFYSIKLLWEGFIFIFKKREH